MSELPDSLKDVNSVLKRGREVLNVIEPKLKHCNVAAVMCNKIYTQAELDQRIAEAIEQACREQREKLIEQVEALYEIYQKKCDTWSEMSPPATEPIEEVLDILSATNTSEGE